MSDTQAYKIRVFVKLIKTNKRLIWHIYLPNLMIMLFSLVAASWYISTFMEHMIIERTQESLKTQGVLLGELIDPYLKENHLEPIDSLCKKAALRTETRITVIMLDGVVIADSKEDPLKMDNHINRPEISKALAGGTGISIRFSGTLRQRMMYVAIPMGKDGNIKAVVRTSLPLTVIDHTVRLIKKRIFAGCICIAVLASFVCYLISRRISRLVEEMKAGADKFAAGELKHTLFPPRIVELASLAEALNRMAVQLNNRIEMVVNQRNEYIAVLSSMIEGVIAVDTNERIIGINDAAAKMFHIMLHDIKGKSVQEALRNRDLNRILEKKLNTESTTKEDIVIFDTGEKIVNTFITPIYNSAGNRIGTLLVFHDVTDVRRLDVMRKDFVANVSHEIRTPLTAIKGFAETLHDCIDEDKEEAKRFLRIIEVHVNRLDVILDDLLALAKLEKKEGGKEFIFKKTRIRDVLETAIQVVEAKAKEKNINLVLDCDKKITAMIDATIFEQAIVNLLDNAITYSPGGKSVWIHVSSDDARISISIKDCGCGIPKEHIPRLFERFYCVDKARSRQLGGTGLGLAIVKHIVSVHEGNVVVESVSGSGSTFTIYLPA